MATVPHWAVATLEATLVVWECPDCVHTSREKRKARREEALAIELLHEKR